MKSNNDVWIQQGLTYFLKYPRAEWYRLVVDGALHATEQGWIGYEKRQPGCLKSAFLGFVEALRNLDELEISLSLIKNLHQFCTCNIKNNECILPGEFRDKEIMMNFGIIGDCVSKQGLFEILEYIEKEGPQYPPGDGPGLRYGYQLHQVIYWDQLNQIRESHQLSNNEEFAHQMHQAILERYRLLGIRRTNFGDYYYVAPMMGDVFYKKIASVLENFNTHLTGEKERDNKFKLIVDLIWELEHLHPFQDANLRTFAILLLTRLLIQHGYPPPTFKDPNIFDAYSKTELYEQVKEAIETSLSIINGCTCVFSFESKMIPEKERHQYFAMIAPLDNYLQEIANISQLKQFSFFNFDQRKGLEKTNNERFLRGATLI